jgi:hypothetical protein
MLKRFAQRRAVERGRTDGGLGGRVDYGEAATERRLPPPTADEQAPAGDLPRRRGHVLPHQHQFSYLDSR